MSKTMEYMDSIRELTERKSWYAVANLLETSEMNISRIRKGEGHPSNEMCFKIADLLEIEPSEVIAAVEMEAAKSEEKREFWKAHFFQHGRAAGIAIGLVLLGSFYGGDTGGLIGGIALSSIDTWNITAHYAKY